MTQKHTIKARALAAGLLPNTVYERMARGETLEQALSRPAKRWGVLARSALACVEANPGLTVEEIAERILEHRERVRGALLAAWRRDRLVCTTERAIVRGRSTVVRRFYPLPSETPAAWVHPIRARALAGRAA